MISQPEVSYSTSSGGGGAHSRGKVKKNKSERRTPAEIFANLPRSKQLKILEDQRKARERASKTSSQKTSAKTQKTAQRVRLGTLKGLCKPKNP